MLMERRAGRGLLRDTEKEARLSWVYRKSNEEQPAQFNQSSHFPIRGTQPLLIVSVSVSDLYLYFFLTAPPISNQTSPSNSDNPSNN